MPILISLDALPRLKPSHKIDRQALLHREDQPHEFLLRAGSPINDPDALERCTPHYHHVKSIWEHLFKRSALPDDVEFKALGGESIMALNMIDEINKGIDPTFDYRQLLALEKVTINSITAALAEKKTHPPDDAFIHPLVLTSKPKSAVFFLPSLLGESSFSYKYLAQRMAVLHDKHIYGLSDPGIADEALSPLSMPHAVERYIRAIKKIQPIGPYELLGFSFGSTLAFEVSQQLNQQGEVVSMVHLLDGFPPYLYQLLSNESYAFCLNTLINLMVSIFNQPFYAETVQTFSVNENEHLCKREQLESAFNLLERELKNTRSKNVLKVAKQHLTFILTTSVPEKKRPISATFYRTKPDQAYADLIHRIPELSAQSSDYHYFFWNHYYAKITHCGELFECDHLEVLNKTGALYLEKANTSRHHRLRPFYRLQQDAPSSSCKFSLFFIKHELIKPCMKMLTDMGLSPQGFTYDYHVRTYAQRDSLYQSQATVTCNIPIAQKKWIQTWMAEWGIVDAPEKRMPLKNRLTPMDPPSPCKGNKAPKFFAEQEEKLKSSTTLIIFLDANPLFILSFNGQLIPTDALNPLKPLLFKPLDETDSTYGYCAPSFESDPHQVFVQISNFLADFITLIASHINDQSFNPASRMS